MSDWLDDLYESPGGDEESILHRKQEAIGFVVAEFNVHDKSKVRLRWIIENKMNVKGYVYSSDILELYYTLLQTGNYEGQLFKYEGVSDILIWKNPFKERRWYIVEAIKYIIGGIIGVAIAKLFGI